MSYPLVEIQFPAPFDKMYEQMMAAAEKADQQGMNPLENWSRCAGICEDAVQSLKEYVLQEGFRDKQSEIRFFKHIKPVFVRWLLYYQQLYLLEKSRPVGGKEVQVKYLEKKLFALTDHFDEHSDLYQYLRVGASYQDELYFLRQERAPAVIASTVKADADPRFSTPQDFQTAVILKNALLEEYLEEALQKLRGTAAEGPKPAAKDDLVWTGPVNGLGHLMRTLVKAGFINHGNIAMSKVMERTEDFLHVSMRNFNRAIQETRIKKDPYEFFNWLIKVSKDDFNDLDDNPKYR